MSNFLKNQCLCYLFYFFIIDFASIKKPIQTNIYIFLVQKQAWAHKRFLGFWKANQKKALILKIAILYIIINKL